MVNHNLSYQKRKRFYNSMLTVYGRKPVLEALRCKDIEVFRLHLAGSNKDGGALTDIMSIVERRNIEVIYHSRKELARISRNGKQDQGVAADLKSKNYLSCQDFIESHSAPDVDNPKPFRLIALDGVTNPQNLGMIVRSVAASPCDGLLLPRKGCADISPLVIKASAGTLFRCPILRCDVLADTLGDLQRIGAKVCTLSSRSEQTLHHFRPNSPIVYVLGNETEGVSETVLKRSDISVRIPMNNGVESLNVAVTAALVAFNN